MKNIPVVSKLVSVNTEEIETDKNDSFGGDSSFISPKSQTVEDTGGPTLVLNEQDKKGCNLLFFSVSKGKVVKKIVGG